jgi:hypothetical protein
VQDTVIRNLIAVGLLLVSQAGDFPPVVALASAMQRRGGAKQRLQQQQIDGLWHEFDSAFDADRCVFCVTRLVNHLRANPPIWEQAVAQSYKFSPMVTAKMQLLEKHGQFNKVLEESLDGLARVLKKEELPVGLAIAKKGAQFLILFSLSFFFFKTAPKSTASSTLACRGGSSRCLAFSCGLTHLRVRAF